MRIPGVLLVTILFFTALSCSPGNGSSQGSMVSHSKPSRITSLVEPAAAVTIPLGEEIRVVLSIPDSVVVDSVKVYLGGHLKRTIPGASGEQNQESFEFMLATEGERTGASPPAPEEKQKKKKPPRGAQDQNPRRGKSQ